MAKAALILAAALLLAGCAPKNVAPHKTQLQIREFQTRVYDDATLKVVMKAVLNALQDEGFLVRSADRELGFISASKEFDVEDATTAFWARFFGGAAARYEKNSQLEASANVTEFGSSTKVRIIFQAKTVDNFGAPITAKQIEDEKHYQDFFAKVDKSIFLERERI